MDGAGADAMRAPERPLLERDLEVTELMKAIAGARRGDGSTVLLLGPAGIGKTALQRLARKRAGGAGLRVLSALGGDLERRLPWAVARELFAAPLREGNAASLLSGSAALAEPVLRAGGAESTNAGDEPGADMLAAALHGLYWLTSNLAERGPLLVAVDDVHLADPPSLSFLVYLAQRVQDLPVLVLMAARPAEPGVEARLFEALAVSGRTFQPAPLSELAARELLARSYTREADPKFARACHAVTAGNPYLLRELGRELRREGVEPTDESVPRVEELTPEAISRSALLRLARFPEPAARLAEAVAVLGTGATLADSAALGGLDVDEAAAAASDLAAAEILASGMPLGFAHPIVRDVLHAGVGAARRARLHARAAELLARRRAPAEEVAVHLMHAEPAADPAAVATLREAAAVALSRGVPERAAEYLRRALDESPEPEVRAALLLQLAQAEAATGSTTVLEHLEEALAIAGPSRQRAEILLRLGWMLFNAGRPAEARDAFLRGSEELADADEDLAAELRTAHMGMGFLVGDLELDRLETLWRGSEGHRTARTRAAEREVLTQLSLAHVFTARDSKRARTLAERALGEGAMLAESGVSLTFSIAASCLIWSDALDSAQREIEMALAQLAERGDALGTAYVRFGRSWVCYWQGRVGEAAADAETAVRAWSAGGRLAGQLPAARYWHALSLLELDQPQAAEGALGEEDERWAEHFRMTWRLGRARVALTQGDPARARDDLRVVEEAARANPYVHTPAIHPWRSDAAIAAARLGDDDEARRLVEEELELTRRFGAPRWIGIALRAAGNVADGNRGVELLSQSVSVLERSPSRLELGRSLVELGAALRKGGSQARAKEALARGLQLAHELGALALERRAREELVVAGARPRRAMQTGPESLTPSERRVCELAAEGAANKQIAQQLFVSLRTVETHLTSAYRKLDISSRDELTRALHAQPAARGRN